MSSERTNVASGSDDGSGWSPERMVARLGGDEGLVRELVSLFLLECPRMMATVRESVEQGSADVVRRAAHAFKGSAANFTDRGAVATAFELEEAGRNGRLEEAPALLARLERDVAALTQQLREFEAKR
jgi:HPt (histidine-containing phosphotransfer) domain-containing protein